jgi:hypothetical protein
VPRSPCALLFLKYHLDFLALHFPIFMRCTLHHAPCCFHALHLIVFVLHPCLALFLSHHTLLLSCLATPLCHALFFLCCALLLLLLHLTTIIFMPCYSCHFVIRALLPCHCTLLFYLASCWALLPYHCALLLTFFKYLFSPYPIVPLVPCCSLSHLVVVPCLVPRLLVFHPHFLV